MNRKLYIICCCSLLIFLIGCTQTEDNSNTIVIEEMQNETIELKNDIVLLNETLSILETQNQELETQNHELDEHIEIMTKDQSDMKELNGELLKVASKYELTLSDSDDFIMPEELELIRLFRLEGDNRTSTYTEYIGDLDAESIIDILEDQVIEKGGEIVQSEVYENVEIYFKARFPSLNSVRMLYVHTPVYLGEKHIVVFENTVTKDYGEYFRDTYMLLFIPMVDGTTKEILVNEYFLTETCEFIYPNLVMKEYHEQLIKNNDSLEVSISGDEALRLPITIVDLGDETNGLEIRFEEDTLPKNKTERDHYLSTLSLTLFTGLKNRNGEVYYIHIGFYEDDKLIKEFNLKDFEGKY